MQKGNKVYALEADKKLLLAADLNQDNEGEGCAAFRGMIF
jgi:hypothetical protein